MKISDFRQKSKEELTKLVADNREKLRQLRFDLAGGKIKNVREIRKVRKEIAQILTLLFAEPHSSHALAEASAAEKHG